MNSESFKKGWGQVRIKDKDAVQKEIMEVLKITSAMHFRVRRKGAIEHTRPEAKAIEAVFAKYGIKEVWGEE